MTKQQIYDIFNGLSQRRKIMYSDTDAVNLLKKYSTIDANEQKFRTYLKMYDAGSSDSRVSQERVLLEKEQFEQFKHFANRIHFRAGKLNVNFEDISYYLEKNFILHRYAGDYSYLSTRSVQHLFNHYKLLLTRNFEDIPLSVQLNHSLKPYLANQYVHTIHSNENLVKDITTRQPDKVQEVASLLADYVNYQEGLIRPEQMLTEETINQPTTTYQKKLSV